MQFPSRDTNTNIMESQKGDLVLHSKSGCIFPCLSHIALGTQTPMSHLRADDSSKEWSSFLWWDFFFPKNCLVDSVKQRDTRHSHTSAPAVTGGGVGAHPKPSGSAGFAILLPAHSQTTLSWLWNCTLSSCRTSWQGEHVGPFQGKEKTHRQNRYLWVCSEKAAESTTMRKCFGRENYGSFSSAGAVTDRGIWTGFFFFLPQKNTCIWVLPCPHCSIYPGYKRELKGSAPSEDQW